MTLHTLVVATGPWDPEPWRAEFQKRADGRRIVFWPEDGVARIAEPYIICSWKADRQLYKQCFICERYADTPMTWLRQCSGRTQTMWWTHSRERKR